MNSEQRRGPHPIWETIDQEMTNIPAGDKAELQGSPESRAEELFALWQDYRRALREVQAFACTEEIKAQHDPRYKVQEFSNPAILKKIESLKNAISERWHDTKTQELFKQSMQRSINEEARTRPGIRKVEEIRNSYEEHTAEREQLYREVFTHRGKDHDELTQIGIAELSAEISTEEVKFEGMERQSPELAARLSFERIKDYRQQLTKDGFIWTPSREAYFKKIIDHLVVVNQNRPLLLAGETGTGKTRLARAVSKRLTGKNPYEVGEEAKTDIRPLLGSRALDAEGSYVTYGQLGQAVTGKESSRDKEHHSGGIFYMDEMNGYPADALRSLVKQISGRRPGEEITFAAWAGQKEKMSPDFGFLGSANLPSSKHPDRADLPVEVARELAALEIDYPPQTADNPELYEMMLAALMDHNNRIRLPNEEIAPEYTEIANTVTNEKHKELNTEVGSGGALWRFANLVADVQRSYKGEENALTPTERDASYLRAAVLDPGLVLSWLAAYRKSALRQNIDLQSFLGEKLQTWAGQKIYPEEDRNLVKKFVAKFNLEIPDRPIRNKHTILSPQEIGALSPRVPREAQAFTEAPQPTEAIVYVNGMEVLYNPNPNSPASGTSMTKKSDNRKQPWIFKGFGLGNEQGKAVLESDQGEIILVSPAEFRREWETASMTFSERFEGKEVKLDVLETRSASEKFYKEHHLVEFAANLPRDIKFSPANETKIREALKMGFDRAMILPAVDIQGKNLDLLIDNLANAEYSGGGVRPEDQYTKAYMDSSAKNSQIRNRPAKGYLLLYQSSEVPQETKVKTPNYLETLFKQKKWNGLTLPEYLLLQRKELEQRQNHNFDAYSDNAAKSQWTWLLDNRVSSGSSSRVVIASWSPGRHRVRVHWDDAGRSDARLGARPAVVVEMI